MDTVNVCERCGSSECLKSALCVVDQLVRGPVGIPYNKWARNEEARPRIVKRK